MHDIQSRRKTDTRVSWSMADMHVFREQRLITRFYLFFWRIFIYIGYKVFITVLLTNTAIVREKISTFFVEIMDLFEYKGQVAAIRGRSFNKQAGFTWIFLSFMDPIQE